MPPTATSHRDPSHRRGPGRAGGSRAPVVFGRRRRNRCRARDRGERPTSVRR
jgi:hypothetical protein